MSRPKLTAKDSQSQTYHIDQRINSKIEQVQSLQVLTERAASILTHAPVGGAGMEDVLAKLTAMQSEINADLTCLESLKHEMERL